MSEMGPKSDSTVKSTVNLMEGSESGLRPKSESKPASWVNQGDVVSCFGDNSSEIQDLEE